MSATTPVVNNMSYANKMSSAQMADESKKATAEGMREIAEALRAREAKTPSDSESDSDFSSDSDSTSSHRRNRKRARKSKSEKAVENRALETRIHYMTLELANTKVEVDEAMAVTENLKKQLVPYQRVNDELAFLKSAMNRALANTDKLTKAQLEGKFKLFVDEARDHASMCGAQITRIEQEEVKQALNRVLEAEKRKVVKLTNSYKMLILKTHVKELVMFIGLWLSVMIALWAILWQLF